MQKISFTIFTPTFNRADLINRVFDSLKLQTYTNFTWLIIDDGSTDNTNEIVNNFKKEANFSINYIYKQNEGKAAAINDALKIADGDWFIVFDSDDWCDPDALEILVDEIESLYELGIDHLYGAISVLKRDTSNTIIGDDYSKISKYGSTYLDRLKMGVKGDKWEIIKTDIHKNFSYPLQNSERYMAPSFPWLSMALTYKTVFLNKSLTMIEYQEHGISKNNIIHRSGSAVTTCYYYREIANIAPSVKYKIKMIINYYRFLFHAQKKSYSPLALIGYFLYRVDKININKIKKK